MFERLMSKTQNNNAGVIWSIEGDQYLAYAMSPKGEIATKSKSSFKNLSLAQEWLRHEGVRSISLKQSSAYLEMIGQDQET